MNRPLKGVGTIFVVLCVVVGVAMYAHSVRPKEIIPWRTDFAASRAEATSGGKPVFAYFTAIWCGPCQSMAGSTWADAGVEAALRDYVPVKIDIDRHPDLADKYQVHAVPAFAILKDDGEALRQTDGALEPEEMVAWLKARK